MDKDVARTKRYKFTIYRILEFEICNELSANKYNLSGWNPDNKEAEYVRIYTLVKIKNFKRKLKKYWFGN